MAVVRPGNRVRARFTEVDPEHTSASFQKYIAGGLAQLRKSRTAVARATVALITSGAVKIDLLSDVTQADFRRLRRSLRDDGIELKPDDFERLRDPTSRPARAVANALRGYQWDDRIYVERGLTAKQLAATLVHEVNHVLNRSEEHYRGQRAAFVEEYRATYAEALFRGERITAAKARKLKNEVIALYGFDRVDPESVPDLPPGRFR